MAQQTRVLDDVEADLRLKAEENGVVCDFENLREFELAGIAAFQEAYELESESPEQSLRMYEEIISDFSPASVAPMALERLLSLAKEYYRDEVRNQHLGILDRYFASIADTTHNQHLAWKSQRASLWAMAAQHRYDEAIAGFEAIIEDHDNLADSVFAVIDAGTLHLEAREWVERNDPERGDALFGSDQRLCPVDFPTHRKHTDELLAMLNGTDTNARVQIPSEFYLSQNYPNPFNSMTRIQYGLANDAHVKVKVYDVSGREVVTLVDREMKAGNYTTPWMATNAQGVPVSSGVYFYRIQAGDFVKTQKMTLLK